MERRNKADQRPSTSIAWPVRTTMKGSLLRCVSTLIAAQVTFFSLYCLVHHAPPHNTVDRGGRPPPITKPVLTPAVNKHNNGPPLQQPPRMPRNVQEMLDDFHRQEQANATTRVFLAHVGKAGGETIRANLRINCPFLGNRRAKQKCWQALFDAFYGPKAQQPGEPALSRLTTGFVHYLDLKPEAENMRATHFLFCIRHPVDRMASWFRYVAPVNCATAPHRAMAASCRVADEISKDPTSFQAQFFRCFPTLDTVPAALAHVLWPNEQSNTTLPSTACTDMLVQTLQGRMGSHMAGHLIANYQVYHHYTLGSLPYIPPWKRCVARNRGNGHQRRTPVLTIRTPYMWQDMQTVDRLLGGNGYFSQAGLQISHQSESFTQKAEIDTHHALPICCILHNEMAVYKELIERSVNMNAAEKEETLTQALTKCQVASWQELIERCRLDGQSLLRRPPFEPFPMV